MAALAADPAVLARTGRALATWSLAREYGFTDADGSQPGWAGHWAAALEPAHGPGGALL